MALNLSAGERLRSLTKGQGLRASADRTERVMVLRRKQALAARAADAGDAPPNRQRPGPPDDPDPARPVVAEHAAAVTAAPAPDANAQMAAAPPPVAVPAAPLTTMPAASLGPSAMPPFVAMPRVEASLFGIGASLGLADPAGFEAVMQRELAGGAQRLDLDVLLAGLRTLTDASGLLAGTPGGQGGSLRDSLSGCDAGSPPRDHTDSR